MTNKATTIGPVEKFYSSSKKWVQGNWEDANGACCLSGAINKCYDNWDDRNIAHKKLRKAIARKTKKGYDYHSVIGWNDKKGRKFSDIKEVVKMANI